MGREKVQDPKAPGAGGRVLIADDDDGVRSSLGLLFRRFGYRVLQAETPEEVESMAREGGFDVALLDMNFSSSTTGEEGIALLRKMKILLPGVPVILITAWATIELAVEGMRYGAFDFIAKPWENRVVLQTVETALELAQQSNGAEEETCSAEQPNVRQQFKGIVGNDPALMRVLETIAQVAPTNAPVLILGESGTGKELIAEAVHRLGKRAKGPFVKVNLGGLSESLFESEMFGHRRGAFTDAYADREGRIAMAEGGTIFLDEIGDLALASQVKLLRVLQDQSYEVLGESKTRRADIRVVSATNADVYGKVRDGSFREDLLYRINLITVTLPPLRERRGDIPLLAEHFLNSFAKANGMDPKELTAVGVRALEAYGFPGNIRELKNIVERAFLLSQGGTIGEESVRLSLQQGGGAAAQPAVTATTLEGMEEEMIRRSLARHNGNVTRVAAELGITRAALYRRIEKYGIQTKR